MTARSTAWTRTTTMLATAAAIAAASLSVGCGVSPAYEPEPRMPTGYAPANSEPATSEQLAAAQANANAGGEIALGADANEYSDTDPSALTEFKPALEGHGAWVDDSTYGTVWVPAESEVGTDFVPYTTSGHWTYDDSASHVWVSDYSWGWAPFHYGRWVHVSRLSGGAWAWIPGRTYSGAWVSWRTGGPDYEYVGWAPLGPDWYWYNGYAVGWTFGYSPYYSYCNRDYFYGSGFNQHVVRGNDPRARDYEAHTRPYTPANPSVGGSGAGRVAATPGVGPGRTAANPRVGPRPSELGIKPENVVAPPVGHAGIARAQALASPHSAVAAGAAPPIQTTRRRPFDHDGIASTPGARGFDGRAPATTSRVDAVARAPQVQGVIPVPPRQSAYNESRPVPVPRGFSEQGARGFGSTPGASAPGSQASQPSFRGSQSAQPAQPTFRSSPSVSQGAPPPGFRSAPSQGSFQPGFRSAPTVSQPTFRSAPSVSSPPPSFRSSPSVSAPSHAAPSISRPSSPSRSSGPAVRRR